MNRQMLKSKITIDPDLLEASDIFEHERGTGEMKVNGAAARLVHRGDTLIIVSYASYDEQELETYEPTVVHVNANNEVIDVNSNVDLLEVAS